MNPILELATMLDRAEWLISALHARSQAPHRGDGSLPTDEEIRDEVTSWLDDYGRMTGTN